MLPSSAPLHEALGLGGFNFDNTRRSARHPAGAQLTAVLRKVVYSLAFNRRRQGRHGGELRAEWTEG